MEKVRSENRERESMSTSLLPMHRGSRMSRSEAGKLCEKCKDKFYNFMLWAILDQVTC